MNFYLFQSIVMFMIVKKMFGHSIGKISNVSLIISPINMTINTTTCESCICIMLRSSTILSLNCFQIDTDQVTCTTFTNHTYMTTTNYHLESNNNSAFYFQQLPLEVFLTTTTTSATINRPQSWIFGKITRKGDVIVGIYNTTAGRSTGGKNGRYSGSSETPQFAIDDSTTTKYLNFGNDGYFDKIVHNPGVGTGFYVTPNISDISIATGLLFATANDFADRDPLTVTLEGTNSTDLDLGSHWILIYNGSTGINHQIDPGRMKFVSQQNFSNTIPFRSYRLLITSQRADEWAVQYAEAQIIGYVYV